MSTTDHNEEISIVRNGYNKIAHRYLKEREKLKTDKWIERLVELLPQNAQILDVGCGAGVPVDDYLTRSGFVVSGIDISPVQIGLARRLCPAASYMVCDLMEYQYIENSFDAIVCLFVMFHIPRNKQLDYLRRMACSLKSGGYALLSMGESDFEGEHIMLGEVMWASQYSASKNIEMIKGAGLAIIESSVMQKVGESHQMILARKL